MISKYLKELIISNNRIIVPDFGAFMIQDSPEGKQISFNDFLKFNDGLLVNQIIKSEKISKNEATELIKEFIKAVEKSFSQGVSFELAGIGLLLKDNQGNIKFEAKISDIPKGVSSTDIKPTIVLDETPIAPEPAKPVTETQAPNIAMPKDEPKKPIVEPTKPEAAKGTTEPKIPTPTAKPAAKNVNQKPNQNYMKAKSNSNTFSIILIIALAILVLGGGTWAWITYDLGSKLFKKEAPVVEAVVVPEPEIAAPDTVVVEEVAPVVVDEAVEKDVKKYYLIAGSFKVPANAERFKKKLMNENFDSEIIVRRNGYHCVSYKTYYTWNESVTGWKTHKDSYPGSWILIK